MGVCDRCRKEAKKLTLHAVTQEKLCMLCLSESGVFSLEDTGLAKGGEKRDSIRIPVSVPTSIVLPSQDGETKRRFKSHSVDVSLSGIGVMWEPCQECGGYAEHSVHAQCVLHPYFIDNPNRQELTVELKVSQTYTLVAGVYTTNILMDESLGLEYVGCKFHSLNLVNRLVLQRMLIDHGKAMGRNGKRL